MIKHVWKVLVAIIQHSQPLRLYGSAVTRSIVWGFLAALQTTLLYVLLDDYSDSVYISGRVTSYIIFSSLLGFVVVFRINFSYGRYQDGRTSLQAMTASWVDSYTKIISFDGGCKATDWDKQMDKGRLDFRRDMAHYFSLVHGLALQFLRVDFDLNNLCTHATEHLPPWDSSFVSGYKAPFSKYFMLSSDHKSRERYLKCTPIPVIELEGVPVSRTESVALDPTPARIKTNVRRPSPLRSFHSHLFSADKSPYIPGGSERVYRVFMWIHERLRKRMTEGGLDMPAPIMATAWTELGLGLQKFERCRYLIDTPFPFPWAQLMIILLLAFQFTVPFVIAATVQSLSMGIILSVVCAMTFWALQETSRELEDPFAYEPNDLPLPRLQYVFNQRLLSILTTEIPSKSDTAGPQLELVQASFTCEYEGGSIEGSGQFKDIEEG